MKKIERKIERIERLVSELQIRLIYKFKDGTLTDKEEQHYNSLKEHLSELYDELENQRKSSVVENDADTMRDMVVVE